MSVLMGGPILVPVMTIANIFCGVWEKQFLGYYSDQALLSPFFSIFSQLSSGDWGQVFTLTFTSIPKMLSSLAQMLIWNYAIFNTGSVIGYLGHVILLGLSVYAILSLVFALRPSGGV